MADPSSDRPDFPVEPIAKVIAPLERFLHVEAAAGVVLLVATATALGLANSPWAEGFLAFWKTKMTLGVGSFEMSYSLQHWINDGLMAVFFFVIGLEVKREIVLGELRDPGRAALPLAAAIGGMLVPAGFYLALQHGQPGQDGWGIPMATDIAFVVGCIALLGKRIPLGLRVLLLSLAIADDIGAILVIAIGYTDSIDVTALILGFAGIGLIGGLARSGVRSLLVYTLLGAAVWLAFHESGIHATLAGVIIGLMTPARSYLSDDVFSKVLHRASDVFHGDGWSGLSHRAAKLRQFKWAARETISPLEYLESTLHPWVGFVIMPLFALANAGVPFSFRDFGDPVAVAIVVGLVAGKPIGILLFSFIAVRLRLAKLPEGVGWGVLAGGACLTGIGFTMALFIAGLALTGPVLDGAKVGILGASAISAALGMCLLGMRRSGAPPL